MAIIATIRRLKFETLIPLFAKFLESHRDSAMLKHSIPALCCESILEKNLPLSNRDDLRDALLSLKGFKGVTGGLEFDKDGEAVKELFVLTLKNKTIQLFEKPESRHGQLIQGARSLRH